MVWQAWLSCFCLTANTRSVGVGRMRKFIVGLVMFCVLLIAANMAMTFVTVVVELSKLKDC